MNSLSGLWHILDAHSDTHTRDFDVWFPPLSGTIYLLLPSHEKSYIKGLLSRFARFHSLTGGNEDVWFIMPGPWPYLLVSLYWASQVGIPKNSLNFTLLVFRFVSSVSAFLVGFFHELDRIMMIGTDSFPSYPNTGNGLPIWKILSWFCFCVSNYCLTWGWVFPLLCNNQIPFSSKQSKTYSFPNSYFCKALGV